MPRIARVVAPGFPHHITQRGNRGITVFHDDAGRQQYLGLLQTYAEKYRLEIWAYCLMSNHVHLVAVPHSESSMARALRDTHQHFALWLNRTQSETGHLWQGRYYSCVLDERHLWAAVRYVETNPVRARMVRKAERFAWSSAAAHCGLKDDGLLSDAFPPQGVVTDWKEWLAEGVPADELHGIRGCTRTGRPCGTDGFVKRIGRLVGRLLLRKKPGRKPKRKAKVRKVKRGKRVKGRRSG